MQATAAPAMPKTAGRYEQETRRRAMLLWLGAMALGSMLGLLLLPERTSYVLLPALLLAAPLPLLWPRYGLYLLFATTLLIEEIRPPAGPPMASARVPFFTNISSFTTLPVQASPAELLFGLILLGYAIQRLRARRSVIRCRDDSSTTRRKDSRDAATGLAAVGTPGAAVLRRNPMLLPVVLFGLTLLLGTLHGLASGGDFKAALWEIRAPFYMLILILLVPLLIEERRQIKTLVWIMILGGAFKALEGVWIALIDLRGAVTSVDTIVGHDDAVFLAADLVLLATMVFVDGERWQRVTLALASPALLYVLFVTNRRAAFVALLIGLAVLSFVRFTEKPGLSFRMGAALLAAAAVYAVLLGVSEGNKVLAQPVRAITSAYNPSTDRDEASNVYRANERIGLWATIKAHPAIGIGFGKRYDVPPEVFDIGFPLYEYIPHNDILRIWAKGGTIGFILHWILFGAAIVYGTIVYRRLRDEKLKALVIFAVCFAVMQITVQYVDMLMTFYRNMIFLGLLVGLVVCCDRLEQREALA